MNLCKLLSLFLSFSLLSAQCSPLYAGQTKKSGSRKTSSSSSTKQSKQDRIFTTMQKVSEQISQKVEKAEQNAGPDYWVQKGAELAEENCDVGGVKCVLNFLQEASQAKDPAKATVCIPVKKRDLKNKKCMNALLFAQGAVHAAVANSKNPWLYYDKKQSSFNGKPTTVTVKPFAIKTQAPAVFQLVAQWGVFYASDLQALNKYFKEVALPSTCGGKNSTCQEEMAAVMGLAFLARGQGQEVRKVAQETAAKILKDKWDSGEGKVVIKGAVTALATLGTQGAWKEIDTFLTKTSLPSTGWDAVSSMSVEGLTSLGLHLNEAGRSSATRYYNRSNRNLRYLDSMAAREQGYKSPFNNPAFQYPDNNTFEEIGYFIGKESANGDVSAQKLAKKIMQSAISYSYVLTTKPAAPKQRPVTTGGAAPAIPAPSTRKFEIYQGHWPVVIGIMAGATKKPWSVVPVNREATLHLIRLIVGGGFWDLNAGTYMRVSNVAIDYANALDKSLKLPKIYQTSSGYKSRKAGYEKAKKIKTTAEYVDMGILLFSAPSMFAALPSLGKSIYSAASWLKNRAVRLLTGKTAAEVATTASKAAQTTAKTTKTTSAAVKSTSSASQGAKQTTAKAASSAKAAPKPAAKPAPSATSARAAQTPAAKPAAAASGEGAATSAHTSTAQKAAASAEKSAAVSPAKLEQQVTGPLDQKVVAAAAEKAPAATTGKAATAAEEAKAVEEARKAEEASKAKAAEETRKAQAANTNNPVSKVEKVTHLSSKDLRLRAVWKLEAEEGKTIGYAKFGTQEEVSRTKAVREILDGDEVVKGGLRQRYKQIEVEYPRILADNFESLPQGARDIIEADVKEIKGAKSFRAADTRLQDGFVTSPVDASGVNMGDLQMQQLRWEPWLTSGISEAEAQATVAAKTRSYLLQQLDYQPVSQAEWQEVEDLIKALNDAGFEHRDLAHNMFIKRNPATRKLKITLLDFELETGKADLEVVQAWGKDFQKYGLMVEEPVSMSVVKQTRIAEQQAAEARLLAEQQAKAAAEKEAKAQAALRDKEHAEFQKLIDEEIKKIKEEAEKARKATEARKAEEARKAQAEAKKAEEAAKLRLPK